MQETKQQPDTSASSQSTGLFLVREPSDLNDEVSAAAAVSKRAASQEKKRCSTT